VRFAFAPLLSSLVLLAPISAHAEDWLALYPECGFGPEARALGRMAMIYPRPGLPAVVRAGERLVTRVRVPSGLTPPPGIQKDRALRGWSAELVGQSIPLGAGGEHVYQTRVVDVRPDGQSTLVYRASIEVPRWAAPGTYGIRMSAPGGSDAVAGAVRIVAPDASLRLLRLPEELVDPDDDQARRALAALATAPHDVVVVRGDRLRGILESAGPNASLPPVMIFDESAPIVLRGDDDALLVFGECDDRYAPFELQLEGLARREERTPRPFADLEGELPRATPSLLEAPTVVTADESLTITAGEGPKELIVRYADDGRGIRLEGSDPLFHPAVTIPMTGQVRTIALRFSLGAGESATLSRTEAGTRPAPAIEIQPRAPVSGDEVRMSVDGEGLALVAWRLEEDVTLVGPRIEHTYRPVGEERVHLFTITDDGVGHAVTDTLIISTREERGCGCGAGAPSGEGGWADLWLIALVLLEMGGRRRNRSPSRQR
jgi:hypothetical protein